MIQNLDDKYFAYEKLPRIDPSVLNELSKLKPWRSFFAIGFDWLIIILCVVVCEKISYWFYPLVFIILGSRFHGLEAMMHEATHFRLHPNKTVNEVIGELSVWPMGLSLYLYRHVRHFSHHKNIGTVKDAHLFQSYRKHPDWYNLPLTPFRLFKNCLIVAMKFPAEVWVGQIYSSAKLLPKINKKLSKRWIGFQFLMFASIITGAIIWGLKIVWIYLLFLVLPGIWVAVFSRYLRLLTEHFGIPSTQENPVAGGETRTVLVTWPVRVMLWPHNLNYHQEHHWFPTIPFYNLPALHRLLCASPQIRSRMHITIGLRDLFNELTYRDKIIRGI